MTTIIHLPIKTFTNYVLRKDDSLTICQQEIYILASGLDGLILMVLAKAPLNFKIELHFQHLSWPSTFKNNKCQKYACVM